MTAVLTACGAEPSGPGDSERPPVLSTQFEGASLGSWSVTGADTVQFALKTDTNASTSYWFAFEVEAAARRAITFRVGAADNMYGAGGWQAKQPVASGDGGATWRRITDTAVKDGFFEFRYTPTSSRDRIALTLPYPLSRWTTYRDSVATSAFVAALDTLGTSLDGNAVELMEVTDPSVSSQDKAQVWAVARLHPGEPEGSWMMEGFVDWVLSADAHAVNLRQRARVLVVPFMNPDGVLAGNQRVNLAGLDLNRQWADTRVDVHPTVDSTRARILRTAADGTGVRIILDFHGAPPTRSNFFFYNDAASVDAPTFGEALSVMQRAIELNADFAPFEFSTGRPVDQGERTRSWAYRFLGVPGLTIEASGVDTPYGPRAALPMTADRYRALGAAVAQAVAEELFP